MDREQLEHPQYRLSLGCQHSLPDFRDYVPKSRPVRDLLKKLKNRGSRNAAGPKKVDLSEFFPAVTDQGESNSCTAHACIALVEYFQRRALGETERLAPLFVYNTTRKLMGHRGDSGADLRATLKAMVHFGAPPLRLSNSDLQGFDQDPEAHLFGMTNGYRSMMYWRLDAREISGTESLASIRAFLAAGFPVVFGFPVTSLAFEVADIPFRPESDPVVGGQAVVAVGYDDGRRNVTRGALLIRNSWGRSWGDQGYGWLPYDYVVEKLAVDFWTVMRPDWVGSGEFQRPQLLD
jgi:C1A family cysteine protease